MMYPSSHNVQVEVTVHRSSSLVFSPFSGDRKYVADRSVSCYVPESKSVHIQHRIHVFQEPVEGTDFRDINLSKGRRGLQTEP